MKDKVAQEKIADRDFERTLPTLVDYFEGLENVPAELLDKSYRASLAYASLYIQELEELGYHKSPERELLLLKEIVEWLLNRLISDGCGGYYFRVSPKEYEEWQALKGRGLDKASLKEKLLFSPGYV